MLKQAIGWTALVAGLAVIAVAARPSSQNTIKDTADVERGRYIVNAFACADCHTPMKLGPNGPEPDATMMFAGHPEQLVMPAAPVLPPGPWVASVAATMTAWAGPWGVSYTANLTPDPETGLGKWTAKDFVDTLRSGRHLGRGREILPPMPWAALRNLSDADLRSVFAYLQTVPPVKNRVPNPQPPVETH